MSSGPTWRPSKCRDCGQPRDDEHHISARALCGPCGRVRWERSAEAARKPICDSPEEQARRWANGMIAKGQELLDYLDATG